MPGLIWHPGRIVADCNSITDYGFGGLRLYDAAKGFQAILSGLSGDRSLCGNPCLSGGQHVG